VKLEAPAKINLYLEVLGRREDGFHELVTVLQTIDLVDDLEVALRPKTAGAPAGQADIDFRLDRESLVGADVPADERNLAVRAARDWLAAAGRLDSHGVDLALLKRIPSGAGLGGGSSDAAAVLTALDTLASGGPELQPLAAALGSDVPFFLVGGTALCLGRGEHVTPIEQPACFELMLGLPDFGVPTPSVYAALDAPTLRTQPNPREHARHWATRLAQADVDALESIYRNDLEPPARTLHAPLDDLLESPAVHLSGSGSTLFLFGSAEQDSGFVCAPSSMRRIRHRSKNR